MNTAKQVQQLVDDQKAAGIALSDAVWNTALACVGWPYVYGAWGEETCTPAHRKSRNHGSTTPSEEHPTIITACQVLRSENRKDNCNGCKWYPNGGCVWEFDCRGFTHDILELYGIKISGGGCTSQWNTASNWTAKGTIDTIPDDILVCLFVNKGSKMEHTGFGYHGQTCECSSGVQHFKTRNKKWTHWALPAGISGDIPDVKPTLRRGDKGAYVTLAQTELINRGYDLGKWGADGSFGAQTEKAVKLFQTDNGLVSDGIIGPKTWDALDSESPTLYTVVVPHLTRTRADALAGQYPGATITEERG